MISANMHTLHIFTDSATSPLKSIAVGAFLSITTQELESYSNCSQPILLDKLLPGIRYFEYESKKSTWSEIKTVINALHSLEINPKITINLYTDCKNLCDLLSWRRAKLEKNNYITRSGKILTNMELYKELFTITRDFQIQVIKIKGHTSAAKRLTAPEKIFSIVDQLCRKKLRSLLKILN